MTDKIITAAEAAKILGVSRPYISRLLKAGKITLTEKSVIAYRDSPKNKGGRPPGRPPGSIALKPKWQVVDVWGKPIADCYFPSDAKALASTNPNYTIKEKPPK